MKMHWKLGGRRLALLAPLAVAALALAVAVFGSVVMGLWNWLMPALFGWRLITFWQALGLLVLSRIIFGGFRCGPGRPMHWRRRILERWEQMTPEEREKFREGMRCGRTGPSGTESTA